MTSRAEAERLRAANRSIVALATRALDRFWASLNLDRPEAARDALLDFLPTLTAAYGDAAATVAADWYEDVREAAGARGVFYADLAEPVPAEQVQAQTRFGASHLWTPTPISTRDFLVGVVSKAVQQPGWDTVTRNAGRDNAAEGWRRVTRAGACKFCRMLEGRGAVYKETTATFASHGSCSCAAVPEFGTGADEADVIAYVASKRTPSEADRQRVRDYLASID